MSDDNEILDVLFHSTIGNSVRSEWPTAALTALRAAGYDIAPADTIRLGRAVETCAPYELHSMGVAYGPGEKNWTLYADDLLAAIYEIARAERGEQ